MPGGLRPSRKTGYFLQQMAGAAAKSGDYAGDFS
jgi:hypothetical protein